MAVFTVNTVNMAHQGHIFITLTAGAQTHTIITTRDEVQSVVQEDTLRDRALVRMVSAVKEANAVTVAQVKAALEGKTFQV